MPAYELSVIFKILNKPELVTALKRTAEVIWEKGGIIRKIENLGISKDLPYKMTAHGTKNRRGSYFLYHFDAPPKTIIELNEHYLREVDIIRPFITKQEEPRTIKCTLEEELLPPAYREDVRKLLEEGKKKKKALFKPFEVDAQTKPF